MIIIQGRASVTWGLLSLLLVIPVTAKPVSFFENVRFSGFGTVGLLRGGNEVLGYRRDLSQDGEFDNDWSFEPDTLLGLQFDLKLTQALDAAVQLVAKERPSSTLDESLEWAFLRYQSTPELTLRGGRLGLDLFMLSEYRNLGFSYLWARPPVEYYGPASYNHFDGADIDYTIDLGEGLLTARLFAGSTQGTFVSPSMVMDVESKPLVGTTLGWEFDHWQARFGLATLKQASRNQRTSQMSVVLKQVTDLWPEAAEIADNLDSKGKRLNYISAGFAYDFNPWLLQSEISYIDSDFNVYNSLWSVYLSLGRQIGSVTLYGLGALAENPDGRVQVASAPPSLAELQQQIQALYDIAFTKQHSLSLGLRWDIRYNLALKVQWDRTWVDEYGGLLWLQKQPLADELILDTLSLNLNFVF
jgi:hypothetical protein